METYAKRHISSEGGGNAGEGRRRHQLAGTWNLALCSLVLLMPIEISISIIISIAQACFNQDGTLNCTQIESRVPCAINEYYFCKKICGMCEENATAIVFNNDPPDTTTFISYVDFATGLAQHHSDKNFHLLSHSKLTDRVFVHFVDTVGKNIKFDTWWSRPDLSWNESDVNHLLANSEVVVALDVDISEKVSFCKNNNLTWTGGEDRYHYMLVIKKCYQIFTHKLSFKKKNEICSETNRKEYIKLPDFAGTSKWKGGSLSQVTSFCDVAKFYFNFKTFYEEIYVLEFHYFPSLGKICWESVCYKFGVDRYPHGYIDWFDEYNGNNTWVYIDNLFRPVGWYEAESRCSKLGLTLVTIYNERQLRTFHEIVAIEETYIKKNGVFYFPIKLSRSPRKPGKRFVYNQNKDSVFADWGEGEPKGANWKKCVGHRVEEKNVTNRPSTIENKGWFTVGCAKKIFKSIVCNKDILATLPEPFFHESRHTQTKQLLKQGSDEVNMVQTSLNYLITAEANLTDQILYKEIQHWFHTCRAEGDMSSALVIPIVYLCDGKWDCPAGTDESFCGFYGVASCTPYEWTCQSRQCVPSEARCDLIKDCQDGSDELDCKGICQHRMCESGRCLPRPWFHDGQDDCDDGEDESGQSLPEETCVFLCNRTQCVTQSMLNDSVLDCKGPEGPLDETLGALESMTCTTQRGQPVINNWAPRCVLARDMFGEIIGCRYFQHLEGCENFTCPLGYAKCPSSFCIPLSYVADGKYDCYEGEDEALPILKDSELEIFPCQLSGKQVVPFFAVCDGRKDCSNGEDELDCGTTCLSDLLCVSGAVSAIKYNKSLPLLDLSFIDDRTRYLDLSGVDVNNFFNMFPRDHLSHLLTLKLSNCNITSVKMKSEVERPDNTANCTLEGRDFKTVQILDLSFNQIKSLPQCSYLRLMSGLRNLNLSHNYQLTQFSTSFCRGYFELEILDLSFTAIYAIKKDQFVDLVNLKSLHLQHSRLVSIDFDVPVKVEYFNVEGMDIKNVARDTLRNVAAAKEIISPTYKLCCPQILDHKNRRDVCQFPRDQQASCDDLVEERFLRLLMWLVSLSIIAGNATTLVYRLTWERQFFSKPFGLYVTNLCASDLLMGVYLMIIGVADAKYHSKYVLYDFSWRKSVMCTVAGTIATLSSLTSSLFLVLITLERYLAVRYPHGDFRLSNKAIIIAVVAAWLFGICVASLPLLPLAQTWEIYSTSGMCIGLPLESDRIPGWQFSATLFIGFNLVLFTTIGAGQAAIFKTIREKGKRIKKTQSKHSQQRANQRMQEFAIAKQLSLVVLTDFMCLCPIIAMGIMVQFGHNVGPAAYRWTAVIFIPINSALNPLLYTLPAIKTKWSNYRIERKKSKQAARRLKEQRGEQKQRQKLLAIKFKRLYMLKRTLISRAQAGQVNKKDLEKLSRRVTAITELFRILVGAGNIKQ